MDRRRFIISGGAWGIVAGSKLGLPFADGAKNSGSIGYVDSWSRHFGEAPPFLQGLRQYPDFGAAVSALENGEINGLLSTPELFAIYRPEMSIFGSLTGLQEASSSAAWVKNNYQRLNQFYSTLGFSGHFIGLGSSSRVRLSRVDAATLEDASARNSIRVAATGTRAIWFEKMGFQVFNGPLFDKLDYQLEQVARKQLDITDAFYPGLLDLAVTHNSDTSLVAYTYHHGQKLFVDSVSRSGTVVDMLTLKGHSLTKNELAVIHNISQQLQTEDMRQSKIIGELESKLQLQQHVIFPENLQSEILDCSRTYVKAAAMTSDPYGLAKSLRKVIS